MDVSVFFLEYVIGTVTVTGDVAGETGVSVESPEMIRFPGTIAFGKALGHD